MRPERLHRVPAAAAELDAEAAQSGNWPGGECVGDAALRCKAAEACADPVEFTRVPAQRVFQLGLPEDVPPKVAPVREE